MGTVRGTKHKKFGPIIVNLSSTGFLRWRITSWGVRIGRWSWNARSGRHSIDLPGPWRWTTKGTQR